MADLINGLGGTSGFGSDFLSRNDDSSTSYISTSSVFESGLNFFGTTYQGFYVNNNGSITFNSQRSQYTPDNISGNSSNPEISPYFADVDTRAGTVTATTGGNSTGSNLVYYNLDTANDRIVVTWDDVGYYSYGTDKLNSFQLILSDTGGGNFNIQFRYEDVQWTTGSASGGSGGLGGTVARAGYTSGNGEDFYELQASGNETSMLTLDSRGGNLGETGVWDFQVTSGSVDNYGDSIVGAESSEVISGGAGLDTVSGGSGDDVIYGNVGDDILYGNVGSDTVFGGRQQDTVFAGQGDDVAYGNFNEDVIYGNYGSDVLYGGQDSDTIYGGQGNDFLLGNAGDDVLIGNRDDDIYFGASGADTFVGGSGNDLVLDFTLGEDKIGRFSSGTDFGQVTENSSGNAVVNYLNGSSIELLGVDINSLGADSFVTL